MNSWGKHAAGLPTLPESPGIEKSLNELVDSAKDLSGKRDNKRIIEEISILNYTGLMIILLESSRLISDIRVVCLLKKSLPLANFYQ